MRIDSEGRKLSEAQQEFFKDSKVRDEEGRLMLVYHATDNDFTVFDREKLGVVTDSNADDVSFAATAHIGFWFNSDNIQKKTAQDKALSGYLKIENPYYVDSIRALSEQTADIYGENYDELQERFESRDYKAVRELGERFADWLKQEGYDGVIVNDEEFGGTSYMVLDSNQFKNRTNQTPTENPDIRYSKRRGNFSKALTSDEWKKYNNAMTSKMDAGLRINDHAMLVESEKGDYSYKLVIYDNTLPDNPISAVYAIVARQDPNAKRNFYERDVAKFIADMEDKYDKWTKHKGFFKSYSRDIGYVFGRYSNESGRFYRYGRPIQSSTENIRQESTGSRVSERVGEAGSISDLGKIQYQLRIEDKNRLDILDKQETRLTADLKTLEKAYAEAIRAEYERSIKPGEETSKRAAEINRKAAKRKPTEQKREPQAEQVHKKWTIEKRDLLW